MIVVGRLLLLGPALLVLSYYRLTSPLAAWWCSCRCCNRTSHHHHQMSSSSSSYSSAASDDYPIPILKECHEKQQVDWNDRMALQACWTAKEKGWQTDDAAVDWRQTQFGVGLFAKQDIAAGTVLRIGVNGRNLQQFTCGQDIEDFCRARGGIDEYLARLNYVKDYLWGYCTVTDDLGYEQKPGDKSQNPAADQQWFYGMWVPGNGLNHNPTPNTVYRTLPGGTEEGIMLVALTDIPKNQELYDDYRRHGSAPPWLQQFALEKGIALNFAGCNNFVLPEEKSEEQQNAD